MRVRVAVTVGVLALSLTASARAAYAPVDQPGPALSVPVAQLQQALRCTAGVRDASRNPVLLVPGTTVNSSEFAWNWEPALSHLAWPYCTVDLPDNGMADIQTAGEYIVYAVRTISALSGRRVDVVGHSQGGMVPRWALRFWPDTRALVAQVIGMSPSNHGTLDAIPACQTGGGCAPSIWQQRTNAVFIAALNSYQETFPGIAYTDIYSRNDEVVVPNFDDSGSSSLHGGGGAITNVAIQQVCPTDVAEHLAVGTYDSVTFALAMDAISHDGPADPARIPASVCTDPLMPGVNPLTFATDFAGTDAVVATTLLTYPHVPAEPPLKCYVTASCGAAGTAGAAGSARRAAAVQGRRVGHRGRRLRHTARTSVRVAP